MLICPLLASCGWACQPGTWLRAVPMWRVEPSCQHYQTQRSSGRLESATHCIVWSFVWPSRKSCLSPALQPHPPPERYPSVHSYLQPDHCIFNTDQVLMILLSTVTFISSHEHDTFNALTFWLLTYLTCTNAWIKFLLSFANNEWNKCFIVFSPFGSLSVLHHSSRLALFWLVGVKWSDHRKRLGHTWRNGKFGSHASHG